MTQLSVLWYSWIRRNIDQRVFLITNKANKTNEVMDFDKAELYNVSKYFNEADKNIEAEEHNDAEVSYEYEKTNDINESNTTNRNSKTKATNKAKEISMDDDIVVFILSLLKFSSYTKYAEKKR